MYRRVVTVLLLLQVLQMVVGLRMRSQLPDSGLTPDVYAMVDGEKSLYCGFDLEGEQLYSLSWYKGRSPILHYKAQSIQRAGVTSREVHATNDSTSNSSITPPSSKAPPPAAALISTLPPNSTATIHQERLHRRWVRATPSIGLPSTPHPSVKGLMRRSAAPSSDVRRRTGGTEEESVRWFPNPGARTRRGGVKDTTRWRQYRELVLSSITPTAAGNYTCEVISQGPVFQTGQLSFNLVVVEAPISEPIMSGTEGPVKEGQEIKAVCHAPNAFPAPTIRFFINDRPVIPQAMERATQVFYNNRFQVSRNVNFMAEKRLFRGGHLKLECRVKLLNMTWSVSDDLTLDSHYHMAHMSHGGAQSNSTYCRRKKLLMFITASVLVSLGVIVLIC